ncbi:MAG TPA: tripartite tricarboxylate transporter substrate binding protein [Burkholderiales bacterium]|jgi:tripartite-type tricarboxylate transporter receptor subunit TctC
MFPFSPAQRCARMLAITFAGVVSACSGAAAAAQAYPARPIHLIVGQGAGGGIDTLARLVGMRMAQGLGQPVIVENKAGAAGIIASEFVAKAPADGYTLLMAPIGNMVFVPLLRTKLPYSPTKDFTPVSMVATFPLLLVVNARTPVKNVRELAAYMKANPAKSNYGGSGAAFQFPVELFRLQTGASGEFIQYKSMGETITAVIAGDLLMSMVDTGPATGPLADGRLRALAVTSHARLPALPAVPTMAEAGMPQLEMRYWAGVFGPAGLPSEVTRRLEAEVNRVVKLPEVGAAMTAIQVTPAGSTSEELGKTLAADLARWREVAQKANIKPVD